MKFGKTARLLAMLGVTAGFFLVEIIVGYICHSMALVADSFHMLSDVMSLIVAFLAVRMSRRKSTKNTFGWARAEILGAFFNAVFLLALCFSIFLEAIERIIHIANPMNGNKSHLKIEDPLLVLIVGCVGLGVNLIGLLLFHQHSHGHGHSHSHGHSHGSHSHPASHDKSGVHDHKSHQRLMSTELASPEQLADQSRPVDQQISQDLLENGPLLDSTAVVVGIGSDTLPEPRIASSSQLNMRGVFLHVMGDALGSVVVIISAAVIYYAEWEHELYIDPGMSLVLVFIITYTTIPLLRESAMILMQTVPTHIEIDDIKSRLLKIDGVLAVHELHIWQLAGDRIIASAHIRCHNLQEYMRVAGKIKNFFHMEGIHSTTMQPEFEEPPVEGAEAEDGGMTMSSCILPCPIDNKKCATRVCCVPSANGPVIIVSGQPEGNEIELRAKALEKVLTTEDAKDGTIRRSKVMDGGS